MRKGRRGENGLSRTNGFVYSPVYIYINETSISYFLVRRFFAVAFDLFSWNFGFEYWMELDGIGAGSACQRLATI